MPLPLESLRPQRLAVRRLWGRRRAARRPPRPALGPRHRPWPPASRRPRSRCETRHCRHIYFHGSATRTGHRFGVHKGGAVLVASSCSTGSILREQPAVDGASQTISYRPHMARFRRSV